MEDLKDKLLFSVIVYSGTEIVPIAPKIVAIPFPVFFRMETQAPILQFFTKSTQINCISFLQNSPTPL